MKGGPSHVDTFDPKPLLQRDDGKPYPFQQPRVQFAETGKLLKSPWSFRPLELPAVRPERPPGQRAFPPCRAARR
ncbi:MAG: DUF1501 domain-containing protein [Chthoniobacter sp.]